MVVTKPWPKKKKHGADGFCIAEPSSLPERGS
ncbi:hypothethical protein (plasmid) [Ralstonia solanacearum PSI07]|nr:hypothethical protein [Ralstonia solanacearum PSI07]